MRRSQIPTIRSVPAIFLETLTGAKKLVAESGPLEREIFAIPSIEGIVLGEIVLLIGEAGKGKRRFGFTKKGMSMQRQIKLMKRQSRIAARQKGNMLILIVAILAGVVLVFILFMLGYIRMLGAHSEQRTAVESAALAAAKDLSRIVVEDPNFGLISLSDAAPVGTNTSAGDRYFMPVHGINTLLGTIRLDLIVADQLNDPVMKEFIDRDYDNAMAAKDRLVAVLDTAISGASTSGGTEPRDKDGAIVDPYDSAVKAYKTNVIRQTGNKFVEGSLKLTLGCIDGGGTTNIPIPKPETLSSVSSTQRIGNYYRSYVNTPFGDKNFVFAGIAEGATIIDNNKFAKTIPGLPYFIPSIVRAEADQMISTSDGANVHRGVQHGAACAQPFNVYDPKPAPGILSISFPDGRPPEIASLGNMWNEPQFSSPSTSDILTPLGGDYPGGGGTLSPNSWSASGGGSSGSAPITVIWSSSFYDWLRRAGTKVDINSLKAAIAAPLPTMVAANKGHSNLFGFNPDGTVRTGQVAIQAMPFMTVSENQFVSVSKAALVSSEPVKYDIYVRDQGNVRGRTGGGRHGGEPLDNAVYAAALAAGAGGSGGTYGGTVTWTPTGASLLGLIGIQGNPWGGGLLGIIPSGVAILGPYGLITLIYPPMNPQWVIGPDNDFGQGVLPAAPIMIFSTGPAGGAQRPTYTANGTVVDVRFRKQIPILAAPPPLSVLAGPRYKLMEMASSGSGP